MPWQATVKLNGETQFRHTSVTLRMVLEAMPTMILNWADRLPNRTSPDAFVIELHRVPAKGGR